MPIHNPQASPASAFPLSWPVGWKRTAPQSRSDARFGRKNRIPGQNYAPAKPVTVSDGVTRILESLERMGISRNDVIISTNIRTRLDGLPRSGERQPEDSGAAVYWRGRSNAPMRCIAIDRYRDVAGNLAAIAATLEAMRTIERHGGAEILERTFQGFAALPAPAPHNWRQTFGFDSFEEVDLSMVDARFRELSKIHHPDVGGSEERFQEIVEARAAARRECGVA